MKPVTISGTAMLYPGKHALTINGENVETLLRRALELNYQEQENPHDIPIELDISILPISLDLRIEHDIDRIIPVAKRSA